MRRALALRESLLGPDHVEVGQTAVALAETLAAAGRSAEGRPLMVKGVRILEEGYGTDDRRAREVRASLESMK